MKPPRIRFTVRRLLVCIAVLGVAFAILRAVRPISKERAIQIAAQHVLRTYPRINFDTYTISASRADWLDEWTVTFTSKNGNFGCLVLVAGGDVYNGSKVSVVEDNSWGNPP